MNIFAVSKNPRKCARALDDKRCSKMILETAQMLCTVLNLEAGEQVTPYKNTHQHNPLIKWASKPKNFAWLWEWGMELGAEHTRRKGKVHKSHSVIIDLQKQWPDRCFTGSRPKRFHNSARRTDLGIDFTHLPVHKAYKKYLNKRWPGDKRKPVWTKCEPPKWKKP